MTLIHLGPFIISWNWTLHALVLGWLCTWHTLWFSSNLPVTVFKLLQRLGWKRREVGFWPVPEAMFAVRSQWETWWSGHVAFSSRAWLYVLRYQLVCPWCAGFHGSWLTGLVLTVISGDLQFLAAGCTVYPAGVYWYFKHMQRK